MARCSTSGSCLHNAHEITLVENTAFDDGADHSDGAQLLLVHDGYSPDDPIRNVSLTDNVFSALAATQLALAFSTFADDIAEFGSADRNRYARPIAEGALFRIWADGWSVPAENLTLAECRHSAPRC